MSGVAEPRKPLTRKRREQMALEQQGRCGCSALPDLHPIYKDFPVCGGRLSQAEGIIDEHLWPLAAGGSNASENRRLLCAPCARLKTDEYDAPLIAKVKRQSGERGDQPTRRARKLRRAAQTKWPSRAMPGTKASGWKKGVNKKAERREPT